jgi:hypothetical protein
LLGRIVQRGQHFADFQAATSAAHDPRAAGVALGIDGGKAADAAQNADANPVVA